MKRPVVEVDENTILDYEFHAKQYTSEGREILASDSLANLKKEIRGRKWRVAWISSRSGSISNGKKKVVEYIYIPRNLQD